MKLAVVVVLMLVAGTNAFWFWGRNQETTATADGAPILDECLEAGASGQCEFYNCFEQRLPCGREFYMQRLGNHYCNRFQRYKDTFTPEGQAFLENTQQCMTEGLMELYQRDYINCHELEHAAVALVRPCYLQHGFCQVLRDNTRHFLTVFQVRDLFSAGAGKLWREVVGLTHECGGQAVMDLLRAASARFSPFREFFSNDDDSEE